MLLIIIFTELFLRDLLHYQIFILKDLSSISNFLSDITLMLENAYQALTALQFNKTSGPDNIGQRILANCAFSLTSYTIMSYL